MFDRAVVLLFFIMACCAAVDSGMEDHGVPMVLEGVQLPLTKEVNGVTLGRNGEGVRHVSFFGMTLRIYVAGFWTAAQMHSVEEIMECQRPKQLDFTFLRSVSQSRVTGAWRHQLDESVTHKYQGYEADRDAFVNAFGPIESGGTETVLMVGNETHLIDQGDFKLKIVGTEFQKSFLSMWFGDQAVTPDLKIGLLGKNRGATRVG